MSERANPVALVIIGAGAGKRFGGPKAVATMRDGRRFLDAIVETARAAFLDPIIAVLPPGVAAPDGVRVVVNAKPESEQIASARLGRKECSPIRGRRRGDPHLVSAMLVCAHIPIARLRS